ncbi:hypothetical protein, partial [Bradyrhizobium oligotrophicum]|uniref:hypothetical protein n=1 Tax=Bradyrhizobium oligotrophicum TaxID=44255 RepID=UPI003EC095C6
ASQRENHGVTFETLSAEVFSSDLRTKPKLNPETRKDSAVHVSLSSSLLVKQPALVSSLELLSASSSIVCFAEEVPMSGALHIADFQRPSRAFLEEKLRSQSDEKQRRSRKSGASVINDVRLAWW